MPDEKFERCFDIKLKNKMDEVPTPIQEKHNISKIEAEKIDNGFDGSIKSLRGSQNDGPVLLNSKQLGPQ